MADRSYNLAIETSGPNGSCSLGCGDKLIASLNLSDHPTTPPNRDRQSPARRLDLMVAIDHLFQTHKVNRSQLGQVYLSIGPGSFTGLRVAVATAKAMASILDVQLVAIPTVDVVAQNAPVTDDSERHLAVCLSYKANTVYTQLFDLVDSRWQPRGTAAVRSIDDWLSTTPCPLAIIAAPTVAFDLNMPGIRRLPEVCLQAHSKAVWSLGRDLARQNRFTDPYQLIPLYARPPEAQRLWEQRQPAAHQNNPYTPIDTIS